MMQITKIFRFEMAHAIHGHDGPCKDIHGHSYELHVTISSTAEAESYIPPPGFVMDFKELKKLVIGTVIQKLDHKLLLSKNYIADHLYLLSLQNLVGVEFEPTAENLLIYTRRQIENLLPPTVQLMELKLYETADSYVRWMRGIVGK